MSTHKKDEEAIQKNVAYYSAFLNAWIENRMEKDKQILTLSSLGVGLLAGTLYDKLETPLQFWMWIASGFLFIVAITIILLIFPKNADYIVGLIHDDGDMRDERLNRELDVMTIYAFRFFLAGVILTFVLFLTKTDFEVTRGHHESYQKVCQKGCEESRQKEIDKSAERCRGIEVSTEKGQRKDKEKVK